MSNSTRSPSERLRKPSALMAVWWTKQSLSPFSGVMKPKPFASLNHFTVPRVRAIAPTPRLFDSVRGPDVPVHRVFYERGPIPRHKNRSPGLPRHYSVDFERGKTPASDTRV